MSQGACPGPIGTDHNYSLFGFDANSRGASALPGPLCQDDSEELFNSAIQALEASLINVGAHAHIDSQARLLYSSRIKQLSTELRDAAMRGDITWEQAATEANLVRNNVMDAIRGKSTSVGRSLAQYLKNEGKTLNALIGEKTVTLFGEGVYFDDLLEAEKNQVFGQVVESAGKSSASVNNAMRIASRAGRGLIFFSVAISIYTVATAEDKADAAKREVVVAGVGITGGVAGGAVAGLACGPGAPVCVAVGAFVGGALAAFGVDFFW